MNSKDKPVAAANEQKLVFGYLKHWYLLKDGLSKWQKSTLNEHADKQLLRYALLFNTYDHAAHVEIYLDGDTLSLRGLLARAWAEKPKEVGSGRSSVMLSGVPDVLVAKRSEARKACMDPETLLGVGDSLGVAVVEDSETATSAAAIAKRIEQEWANVVYDLTRPTKLDPISIAILSWIVSLNVSVDGFYSRTPRFYDRGRRGSRNYDKPLTGRPLSADWTRSALAELREPRESWVDTRYWSYFGKDAGPGWMI